MNNSNTREYFKNAGKDLLDELEKYKISLNLNIQETLDALEKAISTERFEEVFGKSETNFKDLPERNIRAFRKK